MQGSQFSAFTKGYCIEFIPNLMVAVLVLIVGILIADKLRALILTTCESLGIPSAKVISSFVFYFVFITIFFLIIFSLGLYSESDF